MTRNCGLSGAIRRAVKTAPEPAAAPFDKEIPMRSKSLTDAPGAKNHEKIGRDSSPKIPDGTLCALCRSEEPEPAFAEWNEKPGLPHDRWIRG